MTIQATHFHGVTATDPVASKAGGSARFWAAKWVFDIAVALFLLPLVALFSLCLLVINPIFNPGPLLFVQIRMGKNCRAFKAYKFRTMRAAPVIHRGAHDPVEMDRIPTLGHYLRRTRIDELPQIFNVLLGQMSMIGPRPDFFSHARAYVRTIPGYRLRHSVLPGISGLAQVEIGYAVSEDTVRKKVHADLRYIQDAGFRMEGALIVKTIRTVLKGLGV